MMIDQRRLPHSLEVFEAKTLEDVVFCIKEMVVRGAPAIGIAAAYGTAIGIATGCGAGRTSTSLKSSRPTAMDLFHAVDHIIESARSGQNSFIAADSYCEEVVDKCRSIGRHGAGLIRDGMRILTHCNAGALASVDYGTALAPLRVAHQDGRRIFVYVDETRPRLQGALTSWELLNEGIEHRIIADNAAGYYMRAGKVDMVIVGADRITANGDFANKIGTYEKAVLAKENSIPFYVAAPSTTFDFSLASGESIEIEERDEAEVLEILGKRITPNGARALNPAFDVTPARYVTGFITEKGIFKPEDVKRFLGSP